MPSANANEQVKDVEKLDASVRSARVRQAHANAAIDGRHSNITVSCKH